ncbi:MAG: hypothetical protein KAW09_00595 [Thermoplasmata archaeon]|nr:hypothetical protein [Thermoplasmata archaeon]
MIIGNGTAKYHATIISHAREDTFKERETNINTGEVGYLHESESPALKGREKRLAILTAIFFVIGVTLTMGSYAGLMMTINDVLDVPAEDSLESSGSAQSTTFVLQVLLVVGTLLLATAFVLAFWWEQIQIKRIRSIYSGWLD